MRRVLLYAAVGISLYYLGSSLIFRLQLNDMRRIDFRYAQFREALAADRYAEAYTFMSPGYRQSRSMEDFEDAFSGLDLHPLYPTRLLSIRFGTATLLPEHDRYGPIFQSSMVLEWEEIDGEWYLTGEIHQALD